MSGNAIRSVADYRRQAFKNLTPYVSGFYASGAAGYRIPDDNNKAFRRWKFRPRLMRNVSEVDTGAIVMGQSIPFPICVAPTSEHGMAHDEGEVATARGVEATGVGMCISMFSNNSMEEVLNAAPELVGWCHVQVIEDREFITHFIRRAEKCNIKGIIVTIDQPILSKRLYQTEEGDPVEFYQIKRSKNLENTLIALNPELRREIGLGDLFAKKNINGAHSWNDIQWLKSITKLPIAVKGILTEEMAREALDCNVDAIIVSNHGGRQLDGTFSTIDSLPEIVKAVDGKCDVYLDGGIRTGGDIAKAIALGAKAVFIGRAALWGLAAEGSGGVHKVLEMLRDELIMTMKLIGVKSLAELQRTPNLVVHESYLHSKL